MIYVLALITIVALWARVSSHSLQRPRRSRPRPSIGVARSTTYVA